MKIQAYILKSIEVERYSARVFFKSFVKQKAYLFSNL